MTRFRLISRRSLLADDEKDYSLLFDIRRRSEAEEKAVAQEQERRALAWAG